MVFKKHKSLFFLVITFVFLGILTLYFRDIKQKELQDELGKVEIQNVRIGTGTSKGKLGTAIFGEILNNGERIIKIATLNVFFLSESGDISKEHKFFPVNNYSFSDSLPLAPGQLKEFGFPIDEIIPENWGGTISAKLIDLKFK